ncbi:hypothetical protein DC498_14710 [Terrimonas sp.]|uniref:hypothetical protein n=1 Tax=Terrimonas sp. TaxID=1914338 RepID=UPI000D5128FA|nr:hypothetical protein [Terrimonas sp.]PVD51390.1 hypothetical protein DC498_14710 [Terrimonas sp.]
MFKKLCLTAIIGLTILLTSCLDTEEKIVINNNNSGNYTVTIDMSKMLKLAASMGGADKDDAKEKEKKDSTVFFKPYVDTATALTAKEKEMFRDGSMRIKVDEAANEMSITVHFPFKHVSVLPELKASYMQVLDKLNISDKMKNKESPDTDQVEQELSKNKDALNPTQEAYSFSAAPGKITNTLINKALITEKLAKDSSMQMMQQMTMMMGDMNYKTIIVLPKPAKKYNGNEVQASADKKTLTFITTLTDILNRPEAAEYNVEY